MPSDDPPIIILDCNIIIPAVLSSNGPSAEILRRIESRDVLLALSKPVIREYRQMLLHSSIAARTPEMTPANVEALLEKLRYRSLRPEPVPRYFSLPRDPRDELYLDLAAAVQAEFLVSRDKDLHSLPTDPTELGNAFRRSFPRLSVLTPAELFAKLP
jgi:putative PIN family toxin of toxin-antitoxin system